ncbi:MAG: hypothetical protein K9G62_01195 [Alphaproteobacteria bacterium]|nr:hypothetical protein [Alphaproteobacteria bacterium]
MNFRAALIATTALVLIAGVAQAAEQTIVTTAQNLDGSTTKTVTTTRYYYPDNDLNNNGIIDSTEFPVYAYNRWDRNGDGFVTDDEWEVGAVRWYGPANNEYKTYTYWDKDGNGRIDPSEFGTQLTTTNLYSIWDTNADNTIQGDEYAVATFRLYDINNDGQMSLEEWKNAQ